MKRNVFLLHAIGDVDADLVERAAKAPVRKMAALRWLSAAAAAVVLAVGVGAYWMAESGQTPPVENPDVIPSQTTPTEDENSGSVGDGTGGDSWDCPAHSRLYHHFGTELHTYVRALVGDERLDAYFQETDRQNKKEDYKDTTYPYDQCTWPYGGLFNFIEEFQITREQFIEAMGWGEFLDHVYQEGYPVFDDMHYYHFTYQDVVDALYGDDPHLTAWVFYNTADYADEYTYQDFYYDDWVRTKRNGDPLWDYIYDRFKSFTHTDDAVRDYRSVCRELKDEEAENIFHLVQYFGIQRETFIEIYGWADKLDQPAAEHNPYAPYTYNQFLDAVYNEDETLRRWIFNPLVFHPEYPTLEEFATLTEGDRFYFAPFTVTKLKATAEVEEQCTEHNPMYHDLSYFSQDDVKKFKTAYAKKDKEELNVVNFAKYMGHSLTYSFDERYGFSMFSDRNKLAVDHGEGCPYTYGQFYRAVYGGDAKLTEWVFASTDTWPKAEQWPPEGTWPPEGYGYKADVICTEHQPAYHDLSYFPKAMVDKYKASVGSDNPEDYNLFDFINYYQLNVHHLCEYMFFPYYKDDALNEIAYDLSPDGAFTYRQYMDAIYGDYPALTARIFGVVQNRVTTTTTTEADPTQTTTRTSGANTGD